jgi:glycosyltransferase involved in cell wall biosynthesis
MGVDGEDFRRERPYPADGWVQAVGRLVEKKGFRYLIEAASRLGEDGGSSQIVIAGDGELRDELESEAQRLGVSDTVRFAGARPPDEIRDMLEQAAVLAMPCVVAADGDRDSMPVVVKEALAMEILVVASDEVGLPEAVRPPWGRLVPPRDSAALAEALKEVLALPAQERAAAGKAGRRFVLSEFSVEGQTARLAALIEAALAR